MKKLIGLLALISVVLITVGCPQPEPTPLPVENTFTITFDTDGGTEIAPIVYGPSTAGELHEPTLPTKSGYRFMGWTLNGEAFSFQDNDQKNKLIEELKDITLKATWKKTYILTFRANDGTENPRISTIEAVEGVNYYPNSYAMGDGEKITRDGYNFEGWLATEEIEYGDEPGTFIVNKDLTFDAIWSQRGLLIIYHKNDGTGETFNGTVYPEFENRIANTTYGDSNSESVVRLLFWTTEQDGTGKRYYVGETITSTTDITLYAQWSSIKMRLIVGGSFNMGVAYTGTDEEDLLDNPINFYSNGNNNEKPLRNVGISSFYMAETELTQEQWTDIEGDDFDFVTMNGDNIPVHSKTWIEVILFCNSLSVEEGLTPVYTINADLDIHGVDEDAQVTVNWDANGYRLPTEAEWEYAAGGGSSSSRTIYPGTDNPNNIDDYGYINSGNPIALREVEKGNPTLLGLYDLSGNVEEYCWDLYKPGYVNAGTSNPEGPTFAQTNDYSRVVRGGFATSSNPENFKVTARSGKGQASDSGLGLTGFRVVRKYEN